MNQKKTQFIPREPKPRIGDKWDTTHMRFVDTATPAQLRAEMQLIREKKSKLCRKERDIIVGIFS